MEKRSETQGNEPQTREDLRAKLREKINQKRFQRVPTNVPRSKLNKLNEKFKKIASAVEKHIDTSKLSDMNAENIQDVLPNELIEEINEIATEDEMKDLVDYLMKKHAEELKPFLELLKGIMEKSN